MGDDDEAPAWWQLDVAAPAPGTADRLWEELGATAVTLSAAGLSATFAGREAAGAAQVALGQGTVAPAPDEGEWRDLWRAWATTTVAGRLVVQPAWLAPDHRPDRPDRPDTAETAETAETADTADTADTAGGPGRVVIVLEPGAAWGHGGHPSTALVLEVLSARLTGGESVLDVGCGSGALSVAALALGAAEVTAVDIDPVAVTVTRANAVRNGFAERLSATSAPVTSIRGRFDVIVANIGARVLVQLAEALESRLVSGGFLVLSGILDEQAGLVADRFAAFDRFHLVEVRHAGGWAGLVLAAT
jgi:ribosomal protein L11 methyltransferase